MPKDILVNLPYTKEITGIVTDENVDECYKIFKKNNVKVSTICNISSIQNHFSNGD